MASTVTGKGISVTLRQETASQIRIFNHWGLSLDALRVHQEKISRCKILPVYSRYLQPSTLPLKPPESLLSIPSINLKIPLP